MAKRIAVSAEMFVSAYVASETMDDLASSTGLTVGSCASRISNLRKKGVKFPSKFSRAKVELDIDALNSLIEKLTNPAAADEPKSKGKK